MNRQIIDLLLGSGIFVALIKILGDWLNWWKPKEKADVRKIDSEIRKDDAEIDQTNAKITLDILISTRAQLDKEIVDKEKAVKDLENCQIFRITEREQHSLDKMKSTEEVAELKAEVSELKREVGICNKRIAEKEKEIIKLTDYKKANGK